jgi:N-acetylneuraminic acid mutarotase
MITSFYQTGFQNNSPDYTFTTNNFGDPTSIVATPSTTSALITWTTSLSAEGSVDLGVTATPPAVQTYSQATPFETTFSTSHSQTVSGLQPSTSYTFRLKSAYTNGIVVTHPALSTFTTPPFGAPSTIVATPSNTSVVVTWTTGTAAQGSLDLGTSSGNYTLSTPFEPLAVTSHSQTLSGLTPGTTYYYRLKSEFSGGLVVVYTGEQTFTTSAFAFSTSPTASSITTSSATITWTSNMAAQSILDYGTTSGTYTSSLPIEATAVTSHTSNLTGLSAGTTYYYRIRSFTTGSGNFTSSEYSFTTTAATEPTIDKELRGIWMVGGLSGNSVSTVVSSLDLYDPVTNTWYPNVAAGATGTYVPVSFEGATSWLNTSTGHHQIWIFGGFNASGVAQTLVQIYDIENNAWTTGTALPTARANISAVQVYGGFYILGGTTGNASVAWAASNTNYEYIGGSWNPRTTLAANVSERLDWVYNDVIYHLGGRNGASTVVGPAAIGYSITAQFATAAIVAIPANRTGGAVAVWAPSTGPAEALLIGGFSTLTGTTGNLVTVGTTACTALQTLHYLNYPFMSPSVWTTNASYNYPFGVGFGSAAVYQNTLYYFGGTTTVVTASASGLSSVYSLDLTSFNTWSSALAVPNMPTPRYGFVAVTIQQ